MQLSDELLTQISYVKISKYRTKVMKTLEGDVKIPSQIARDSDILQNHISSTLQQLREHELVECINPEVRKGRLYRLTDVGEDVVKNLD
ncbi:MAG: transcriptional regulator [Methanosphaera sp.]|nr:transcriptional regulator [Methanosphaera sp.]